MSKKTPIQWTHSTVNPVMGCDGCELYPSVGLLRTTIMEVLTAPGNNLGPDAETIIDREIAAGPQYAKRNLAMIAKRLVETTISQPNHLRTAAAIEAAVSKLFVCYAADLHRFFNANGRSAGYAYPFEQPKQFTGRTAAVANYGPPATHEVADKPWLHGYRRLIFISDMGDALSGVVPFEFLDREIIQPVGSVAGLKHVWLWVSKRPGRMAAFSHWLNDRGTAWPDNLVAMTTVTGPETVSRVDQLRQVNARFRGLSLEPLWSDVEISLQGIDWVIVGGQSGSNARPFHVEWMEKIQRQSQQQGAAFFAKQLGRCPFYRDQLLSLNDSHGGDWNEWPKHIRVREIPKAWKHLS